MLVRNHRFAVFHVDVDERLHDNLLRRYVPFGHSLAKR
jgi:hypothetical protein